MCYSVQQVSIKRDRNTGKNLGYGFVKMSSNEEAVAAKHAMHRYFTHYYYNIRLNISHSEAAVLYSSIDQSLRAY
jgi:RNA recognition motif-containing protein